MFRITLVDDDCGTMSFMCTPDETINSILIERNMNPDRKIVYLNGKILSRNRMAEPLNIKDNAFIAVRNKTIIRA